MMTNKLSFKGSLSPEQKVRLQALISKPKENDPVSSKEHSRSARKKQVRDAIQWLATTYPDGLCLEG